MKKTYTKPMVTFEELALDMPVAANCDQNYIYHIRDFHVQFGGFNTSCENYLDESAMNTLLQVPEYDKLCYYSAVSKPLMS